MQRVNDIKNAVAHPAHKVMNGLEIILGETGALAYLSYMAERLTAMKRLLKSTGSIYLHCDPTMSHYLKAVMDAIFGVKNFIDEIVWNYGTPSGGRSAGNKPVKTHDIILAYAMNYGSHTYNKEFTPYSEKYIRERFCYTDETGRKYQTRKRKNGTIQRQYLDKSPGVPLSNVWTDIKQIYAMHLVHRKKEDLGYPTQKPTKLLERILRISSNKGDTILDPFCGCGTTIEAAHKLQRDWIGIDISPFAVDLIRDRRMKDVPIEVRGIPEDMSGARRLAQEKPFDFEKWAVFRIPGLAPNDKQVSDGGIDGRGTLVDKPDDHDSKLVLAQIKGGKYSASALRDFLHVIDRDGAAMGVYITLDPVESRNARVETSKKGSIQYGASRFPRAQLWSIHDHFSGNRPDIPPMNDPFTGLSHQFLVFDGLGVHNAVDGIAEYMGIVSIVETPFEFSEIASQMLGTHLVKRTDYGAFRASCSECVQCEVRRRPPPKSI